MTTLRTVLHALLTLTLALASTARGESAPRPLKLVVALQWEGRDLKPHNLEALRAFRNVFSDVVFVHFLSPAYFVRGEDAAAQATLAVRSVMRPKDRLAVAMGGWKSVTAKAGVIFRNGPTFWGNSLGKDDCAVDCGLDIPVNIYPEKDLDQLFGASLDVLEAHGFGRPKGMIAEGWVAAPEVLEAATRVGIRYDFSAVPPELLGARARNFPLYQWVKGLWASITPHTQPFVIPTTAASLREIPQSLASMDYLTPDETLTLFKEYAENLRKNPEHELTFPLVIYQETAHVTLPALAKVLQGIFAYAAGNGIPLEPLELAELELPSASAVSYAPDLDPERHGPKSLHEPLVH